MTPREIFGTEEFTILNISPLIGNKRCAVEEMLSICTFAEYGGNIEPLTEEIRSQILKHR